MASRSAARAAFRMATSLSGVSAFAEPMRARRSWPASRVMAVAESVNLPSPEKKLLRLAVASWACWLVTYMVPSLILRNDEVPLLIWAPSCDKGYRAPRLGNYGESEAAALRRVKSSPIIRRPTRILSDQRKYRRRSG